DGCRCGPDPPHGDGAGRTRGVLGLEQDLFADPRHWTRELGRAQLVQVAVVTADEAPLAVLVVELDLTVDHRRPPRWDCRWCERAPASMASGMSRVGDRDRC